MTCEDEDGNNICDYYVSSDQTEIYCDAHIQQPVWVHTHATVRCDKCGLERSGDYSWRVQE